MRRTGLIAAREIGAYAGTLSFWLALVAGPVLMILAALMMGPVMNARAPERAIAVASSDSRLAAAARASVLEAGRLQDRPVRLAPPGEAQTRVAIARRPDGRVIVETHGAPLTALDWALMRRDLEAGERDGVAVLSQVVAPGPDADADAATRGAAGRFALVVLLWMNLVGALGMLLQAVVRERTNRALEILLTSARPLEILLGKLLGVAALSLVVVAGWLAVGAAAAGAGAALGVAEVRNMASAVGGDPSRLALAGVVYVLAFAMYGGAILGLSALAKDMPAAQNASRPIFGLLLLAFFAAIGMISAPERLAWLLWAPPLTPFVLLMRAPGDLALVEAAGALALMALSTGVVFVLAARSVGARPVWRIGRARSRGTLAVQDS